jgi:hypothetical protein
MPTMLGRSAEMVVVAALKGQRPVILDDVEYGGVLVFGLGGMQVRIFDTKLNSVTHCTLT